MKKNLSLFAVLIVLIAVTYFAQEKRSEKEYSRSLLRGQIIAEEITELKIPAIHAKKKDGQWWSNSTLLSHNVLRQIEKKLHELKEVKEIKGEWKSFFVSPIEFDVNGKKWAIGDLSLDKQSFYVAHDGKISLAILDGEGASFTDNEASMEGIKLNELKVLLTKNAQELKENQLFRFYPDLPLERVIIHSDGNLPFELNLLENKTLPEPIPGVSVHSKLKVKFMTLLTQLTLKEEIPYSQKLQVRRMAEVSFLSENKKISWELWLMDKNKADAVIIDTENKRAYHMIGGTLRLFFVQLQDYWDKKVIPPSAFQTFTRLPVVFTQGDKKVNVTVINREPLDFEASGHKVKPGNMQDLFTFIFNLGPADQAQRVSQLSSSERKQILSEIHLKISLMGQDLLLWRKREELIVVNLTQGFKAHFNLQLENFNGRFEDVLE